MKNNEKKQNDLQKSTENTEELEQLEMLDGVYGNENEKPETPPQTKFTAEEKRKKALLEFRDLLAGAAFRHGGGVGCSCHGATLAEGRR